MLIKAYKYFTRKAFNLFSRKKAFPLEATSSLDSEIIAEYNATRNISNRKFICYAPFKNIYFNIQGDAAPCWLTFKDPDSYPEKSIHDIWFGETFAALRNNIKKCDLSGKCSVCNHYINSKNYVTPLAKAYDNDYPDQVYPVMMELELANTCNLECIMCNGKLSSSVRRNREKLDLRPIPYDETFVNQLDEFLPHLYEARFNGGEPFLNDIYFRIWENILKIKPSMKVVIATNGTVMNDKVKNMLERGRFDINLSCDSLIKETYEQIRVNAVMENTLANIDWFSDYCNRKGTTLCILTNPMRQNWQEMPEFIKFCNARNLPIWFNTIHRPADCAIWTLSSNELENIFETLSQFDFEVNPLKPQTYHNRKVYKNLVFGQIKTWMEEAAVREKETADGQEDVSFSGNKQTAFEEMDTDDPKAYFYENLKRSVLSSDMDDDKKNIKTEELIRKFDRLAEVVKEEFNEEDFFRKLVHIPVEKIISDLEQKEHDELIIIARKFYLQF